MKLNIAQTLPLAAVTMLCVTGMAQGAPVIVTPAAPAGWYSDGNSGGGSSAITGTAPRSGNGSVEATGDRTRWTYGNPFLSGPQTNLGLLSQLTDFAGEYMIDLASVSLLDPDYTPAFRLHIIDGQTRSELIWEGAYNGVYGNPPANAKGVWHTIDFDSANLWRFVTGTGVTLNGGGAQVNQNVANWLACSGAPYNSPCYSNNAYVAAISFGIGSSVGGGFKAFGDNITLQFGTLPATTWNFEVAQVPEPTALALLGLALAGVTRRVRRG